MAGGCDGAGDVIVEGLAEGSEVEVVVDAAELFGGFTHPGGAPAQRHLTVTPARERPGSRLSAVGTGRGGLCLLRLFKAAGR